jgi:hypothetical protein
VTETGGDEIDSVKMRDWTSPMIESFQDNQKELVTILSADKKSWHYKTFFILRNQCSGIVS